MRIRSAIVALVIGAAPSSAQDFTAQGMILLGFSLRNASVAQVVGKASATRPELALAGRWKGVVGLRLRLGGGTFSADSSSEAVGTVSHGVIEVDAGPDYLRATVGLGLRSFTGRFGAQTWQFLRIGAASSLPFGSSGFAASFWAAMYLGAADANGGEGEAGLVYAPGNLPGRLPLFVSLRYRLERFTVEAPPASGGDRPEEIGSVLLGVGIRLPLN